MAEVAEKAPLRGSGQAGGQISTVWDGVGADARMASNIGSSVTNIEASVTNIGASVANIGSSVTDIGSSVTTFESLALNVRAKAIEAARLAARVCGLGGRRGGGRARGVVAVVDRGYCAGRRPAVRRLSSRGGRTGKSARRVTSPPASTSAARRGRLARGDRLSRLLSRGRGGRGR